mgnify:CR=1 FL=1
MNKYLMILSLSGFIYFFSGCDLSKKPAIGFEDEIYIVADSIDYEKLSGCLLYTSDAADERSSVDLGGRRIIKKKKTVDISKDGRI